ncbi:MACPF domain-containing protein [Sphingobacterium sp. lm-10]|uniref:MAC/perforin domain-containing protein n=1 Tax=Sphingobacterium sp. lm-10 TaxID=2944904 RepID=UPI00201FDE9D|nr:MAC/perforin domain-containing protein [Sphingobacterium sp. lm-10]MCL7986826.1 MACPF domain-containing protein [Sphingobacterium sp. lm-10]
MKLKQFAKLAAISAGLLFAAACQKSILTDSETSGGSSTNPRSARHPEYHHIGYGYDATGEYANQSAVKNSVVDVARLSASGQGRYVSGPSSGQRYYEEYGENAEQYSRKVSQKISATTGFPLFGGTISASYSSSNEGSYSFDGKHVYGNYHLLIRKRRINLNAPPETLQQFLSPQFSLDIVSQSPEYIVRNYGTHVMTDIYAGGKFNMTFQSETRNSNRTEAARSGIKASASFVFNASVEEANSVDVSQANQNFSKKLVYYTEGGNSSIGLRGEINLDISNPTINTNNWQNSVTWDNAELIDFGPDGLIPIYDLIPNPTKRQQVKGYVDHYLSNNTVKNIHRRVPVYSLYAPTTRNQSHNHWLALNPGAEWAQAVNEGISFYAFSYQAPGTVPVYRYYHQRFNNIIHVINPGRENLSGFTYSHIDFYAYPTPNNTNGTPTIPIHRYQDVRNFDHYFTPVRTNINNYQYEGIEFHAHNN